VSATLAVGIALTKIVLRAAGEGDLATSLGDGKEAATNLLTLLRRPAGRDAVTKRIADQLDGFLSVEFRQADDSDRAAAISEATDVLESALRDDQRLVDAVIEPLRLRRYFDEAGAAARRANLGGDAGGIFDLLLDWSVDWVAKHAPKSEVFNRAATTRLLQLTDGIASSTSQTKEGVLELQQSVQALAARSRLDPLANDEIERYAQVVSALAPSVLLGRTREMADLEQFALFGPGQWLGLEGAAQTGKTALMSSFCLTPPPNVVIVPFFVRESQATANDRDSFLARVIPHLAHLSGLDSATVDPNAARAEDSFRKHLENAAKRCSERGITLLLLIDALDEDAYVIDRSKTKPSIAAVLPAELPPGVRVVVSTRPNPPLPNDVADSIGNGNCHPMRERTMWRSLDPSPHARAAFSMGDVHELMLLQPGSDIAAFLAASGGQLTMSDLAELTASDVSAVNKVIVTSPGRLLLPDRSRRAVSYSLGHALITQMVLSILEPKLLDSEAPDPDDNAAWNEIKTRVLAPWRTRITLWGKKYASHDWLGNTPAYLLDDAYIALLAENREFHSDLLSTLTSDSRISALYYRHDDTHYATVSQIRRATTRIIEGGGSDLAGPDLYVLGKLVAVQSNLATHKGKVPAQLPAAFGSLGKYAIAVNVALSIPKAADRLEAFTELVGALVRSGQSAKAVEALGLAKSILLVIVDPREQIQGRRQIAVAMSQVGSIAEALSQVQAIQSPATGALILAEMSRVFTAAGNLEEGQSLASKSMLIVDQLSQFHSLECIAPAALALAEAGMTEEAGAAALEAQQRVELLPKAASRAHVLRVTAVAYAKAGYQLEAEGVAQQALETASSIGNSNTRGRLRAAVAQSFVEIGLADQAIHIATSISDKAGQTWALAAVAHALAASGQAIQAFEVAQIARKDAATIDKPGVRSRILVTAALALHRSGRLDEAHTVTKEADTAAVETANAGSRALAQTTAARALHIAANGNQPSDALRLASAIKRVEDRVSIFGQLAKVLAEAHHPRCAFEAATEASTHANKISSSRNRDHALAAVAEAYGAAGSLNEVKSTLESIQDPGTSTRGAILAAEALASVGRKEAAYGAISEARNFASGIVHPDARAHAAASISLALSAVGVIDEAHSIAVEARSDLVPTSKTMGGALALSQVALAFLAAGFADDARDTANEAHDMAKGLASRFGRAVALAQVAQALVAVGRGEESRAAAAAARQEAVAIRRSNRRSSVLQQVAQALAATGNIAEALEVAGDITNYHGRAKAFADISGVLARGDEMNGALDALARSWVAAGTLLETWHLLVSIRPDVAHRLVAENAIDPA
jgi:tetratricopeptide (TPR) repeat protein